MYYFFFVAISNALRMDVSYFYAHELQSILVKYVKQTKITVEYQLFFFFLSLLSFPPLPVSSNRARNCGLVSLSFLGEPSSPRSARLFDHASVLNTLQTVSARVKLIS